VFNEQSDYGVWTACLTIFLNSCKAKEKERERETYAKNKERVHGVTLFWLATGLIPGNQNMMFLSLFIKVPRRTRFFLFPLILIWWNGFIYAHFDDGQRGARARIFSSFQVLACGDCGSLFSNIGMPSPWLVTQTTMNEWMMNEKGYVDRTEEQTDLVKREWARSYLSHRDNTF
jgi:hypothetical protein